MSRILSAVLLAFVATCVPGLAQESKPAPAAEGQACGGIQGLKCAKDLWCDPRAGECKAHDLDGVCVKVSKACTEDYKPVCGCNGKTYSNDCERQGKKQQKDHDGECTKSKGKSKSQTRPGS